MTVKLSQMALLSAGLTIKMVSSLIKTIKVTNNWIIKFYNISSGSVQKF
jgi:hypothetical protein